MNQHSPPPLDDAHACDHRCAMNGVRTLDRRTLLQMTVGGALGMLLRPGLGELVAGQTGGAGNEKSVILLWMHGGMSQIDSVDPKHDSRYAGPFRHIRTNLPGVHFSEHIPLLARQMHRMAVVRSMRSPESEHNRAQFYANTGYQPLSTLDNPSIGSIVAHELGAQPMQRADREGLPAFISIGHTAWGPGCLGIEHAPFVVWDPNRPPDNLGLPEGVTEERINRRLDLLHALEEGSAATTGTRAARYRDQGRVGARKFMTSSRLQAFNLNEEPSILRDAYGRNGFGQGCLLARRLVEAGVRFVQVHLANWDSHADNFNAHQRLLGILDPGMAALLNDLSSRGLLDSTLVVCMGEFGRTPRINNAAGRDHHPAAWSVMLAGGGIAGGQVYGATDPGGMTITESPVTIPDLFATFCHTLDIDANREFIAAGGRPITLVDKGNVIAPLVEDAQPRPYTEAAMAGA